ncbi:MAG TPA: MBL fold metallo-hydrolase RNA specificity domain-containing protein, partial [Candidatus Limnocylindrales bacterium]|nr:MBL fold metallo-hydrolase RNA specificity domain-containing protein [Candidatus Limnocylindrales bacterium]
DCGMFQGSPNESVRNRVPFGFEPSELDTVLLTHAHLDHCGRLPLLVRGGYTGKIHATAGTIELATLVLLDSGHLHEEFAKREARWEKRHPGEVEADDRKEAEAYQAAIDLAASGGSEEGAVETADAPRAAVAAATSTAEAMTAGPRQPPEAGEHVETTIEPEPPVDWSTRDPEAELRGQPPALDIDLDEPLYTVKDAENTLDHFRPIDYDEEREVAPGVFATFLDAGHILGSAIIRLRVQDGGEERVVVFSGDLGRPGTPIIRDPTYLTDADYVLVESTYGGREHEPQDEAIRVLAETVRLVAESNGVLLVPSFAIGRTQEVVWELDRLIENGEIPLLPLYLDSPMATKATGIYRRYSEYFDEETSKLLHDGATPLDYPSQVVTNTPKDSQAIQYAPRPYMIVASNGMLTGGRVVGHLRNLIDDPNATLLFVGYQGVGTLGAHLQAGAKTVRLDGQTRQVRCNVRSIAGFSAHADEGELLDWIGRFAGEKRAGDAGFPRKVFLVHGDPEAQTALEPKVRELGFETHVPKWHQRVTLE